MEVQGLVSQPCQMKEEVRVGPTFFNFLMHVGPDLYSERRVRPLWTKLLYVELDPLKNNNVNIGL